MVNSQIRIQMFDGDLSVADKRTALRPVQPNERILALDVLRGFAMLGVLLAYALWSLGSPPGRTYSQADRIVDWVATVLIDSKAYTTLAILFGLGFSIQLARASDRGLSVVPFYLRRLLALIGIGLVHALLLRNGDILVPYATIGFILPLLRKASNRALLICGLIGLFFPDISYIVWGMSGIPFPRRPNTEGMSHISSNLVWVRYWYSTAITLWPASIPMFLFGMYLGRRRFFENPHEHRRLLWGVLIGGLILGVAGGAGIEFMIRAWAKSRPPVWMFFLATLLKNVHAWGFAAFYSSSLVLLLQRQRWQRFLAPLSAVGRMALTNYLLQSILLVPLCMAFSLFDRVTPVMGLLLAIAVAMIQVPLSNWWLTRFRFGPAEWLWRSITYGQAQKMRDEKYVSNQFAARIVGERV